MRTVLGLTLVIGLGVGCYVIAEEATKQPDQKVAKSDGCCAKKAKTACGAADQSLTELPSYKRAEAALASWTEVPARLAGMTEADKTELQAAGKRLKESHPAAAVMPATFTYLREATATVAALDAAAAGLCAKSAGEGGCPTKAAAMASAKADMEKSSRLAAKANELMLVAYKSSGSCRDKSSCSKDKTASAEGCTKSAEVKLAAGEEGEKKGGCGKDKAVAQTCTKNEQVKLAAGEEGEKKGGCGKDKAVAQTCTKTEEVKLAAGEEGEKKGGCGKDKAVAQTCTKTEEVKLAAGEEGEKKGGCGKDKAVAQSCTKTEEVKLAAGEEGEKKGGCGKDKAVAQTCTKTEEVKLAAGEESEKKGGCGKDKAVAQTCTKTEEVKLAAGEEGEKKACNKADGAKCNKTAALAAGGCDKSKAEPAAVKAKADELIAQSGTLLAKWSGVEFSLAGMEDGDRTAAEKAASMMMSKCPAGSRMPETIGAAADLLRDAAKFEAQARAICAKNGLCEAMPAELKEIAQARSMLLNATLNVLGRTEVQMKPVRQMASAN